MPPLSPIFDGSVKFGAAEAFPDTAQDNYTAAIGRMRRQCYSRLE